MWKLSYKAESVGFVQGWLQASGSNFLDALEMLANRESLFLFQTVVVCVSSSFISYKFLVKQTLGRIVLSGHDLFPSR